MLIFNDLLQLRNKKKKNKYSRKEKKLYINYSEINRKK